MNPSSLSISSLQKAKLSLTGNQLKPYVMACLLLFSAGLFSQNETSKWCFGQTAGLNFMTVPPSVIPCAMTTQEGCSSIADGAGNLLFYTDGITVYNSQNNVMANGNGLQGNSSSTQSGVIVKQPGSANIYYIFTCSTANGPVDYSTVDMSLAAGLGSVTVLNATLNVGCTEKLTSVRHCNGVDVWVLAHDMNNNNFRAYLVTSSGVNTTAIISSVGSIHTNAIGYLRASPNGRKLGTGVYGVDQFELYDFDPSTGVVSNQLVLASFSSPYGCEFSPDGTKFYGTREGSQNNILYQWDLCAGSNQAIIASQFTIATTPNVQVFALQAAQNGKIYLSRYNQTELGVINNPNVYGSGCNYVDQGLSVAPGTCRLGLPNFITSFLNTPQTFTYTQGGSCSGLAFTAPPSLQNGGGNSCTAASPVLSLNWTFGDPGSGAANTSTLTNPLHTYPGPGNYTVQLVTIGTCGNDTVRLPVTVIQPTIQVSISPTFTQVSCTSSLSAINLGLGFGNTNPIPSYTITWSPIPNGIISNTQTSVSGGTIAPGVYSASVSLNDGCQALTASFTISPVQTPVVFNMASGYTVNCFQPTVVATLDPANSYTWSSLSAAPFSGNTASLTAFSVGTWTVRAGFGSCQYTHTFTVTQDFASPTATISPASQSISCLSSITTVTAVSTPTINVTHLWISPQGGTLSAGSGLSIFLPGGPGTFTHVIINNVNGCSSQRLFSITTNDAFPTFTLTSPQNFTLGCSTKSTAIVNIVDPQTQNSGAVSYTLIGPSTSPNYVLPPSGPAVYTVNAPGTWTAITIDNVSMCATRVQFSIIQNTFQPQIAAIVPSRILSCQVPSVILQGVSLTPNVSYNWTFPGVPGNQLNDSIKVSVTSTPNSSVIANYTLTVVDNNNSCFSQTVIPMYQNIYPPLPLIAGGNEISCNIYSVSLSNMSSSTIPPSTVFTTGQAIISYLWQGPTPQQPLQLSSSYLAYTPGTYTMMIRDLNNGCTAVATKTIDDARDYPVVNVLAPFVLDCGAASVKIYPQILGDTKNFSYAWTVGSSAFVSGVTTPTLTTNLPGQYTITVSNGVNGCVTNKSMYVVNGTLTAGFNATPDNGFAPLPVSFQNTSFSTINSLSVTSVWSYGNGTTSTTTTNINTSALYTAPGDYTVTMFASKGTCLDTVIKVIHVDIPSELEVPNVFTPNGDGSNDVFFLKTAGLGEIQAHIYDRWGNKVFEQTSNTGNIAWDGKNTYGKEVADGTYIYIITAKGTDGVDYKTKGTVSVYR